MIAIRLLGGAKKALHDEPSIQFDVQSATVSEILDFLKSRSSRPDLLDPANLIIAVNGADSSALGGQSTLVKSGDTVTVVTVVHGGSFFREKEIRVAVMALEHLPVADVAGMLAELRKLQRGVLAQAILPDAVYGLEHVRRVLAIATEAERRGIMLADRVETEFLLRMACTKQISEAISLVGIKAGSPACLVAWSSDPKSLEMFVQSVGLRFKAGTLGFERDPAKHDGLARRLRLGPHVSPDILLGHLVENAAILSR